MKWVVIFLLGCAFVGLCIKWWITLTLSFVHECPENIPVQIDKSRGDNNKMIGDNFGSWIYLNFRESLSISNPSVGGVNPAWRSRLIRPPMNRNHIFGQMGWVTTTGTAFPLREGSIMLSKAVCFLGHLQHEISKRSVAVWPQPRHLRRHLVLLHFHLLENNT